MSIPDTIARHMAQADNENLWKRNKQGEWEPSHRGQVPVVAAAAFDALREVLG